MRALALALLAAAPPAPTHAQAISDLTGLTETLQPGSRPARARRGSVLLAVDDQDGWWRPGLSRARGLPSRVVEQALRAGVTNLQRTIAGRWAVNPGVARGRVRVGGEIIAPDWESDGLAGTAACASGSGVGGTLGVRARDLVPGFTVSCGPTIGDRMGVRSTPAGVGPLPPARRSGPGIMGNGRTPEVLRSDLYREPIEASLNLHTERTRLDAAFRLPDACASRARGAGRLRDLEARRRSVYH
jgi:hypothetical protein